MDWNPEIVEALRRLNPTQPPGSAEFIGREQALPGRGWDLPDRLVPLLLAGNRFRGLLHGATGVGKSTELARWEMDLRGQINVVRVELRPAANLETSLFGALADVAAQRGSRTAAGQLALAVGAANTGLTRPAVRPTDLRDAIQLLTEPDRPTLLLIDGAELWPDAAAFGPGSVFCGEDLPALVATAPSWIISQPSEARDTRFDHVWHLPPFPVADSGGKPNPTVIEHFASGLQTRFAGLDIWDRSDEPLRRVAWSSGGIPRHAVTLLRSAVLAGARIGRVSSGHVLQAERELRQDLEQGLRPADLDALRMTVRDDRFYFGDPRLVATGAVICYEGRDRRYWRLHPLLAALIREPLL